VTVSGVVGFKCGRNLLLLGEETRRSWPRGLSRFFVGMAKRKCTADDDCCFALPRLDLIG
jgi:hypothetical protein